MNFDFFLGIGEMTPHLDKEQTNKKFFCANKCLSFYTCSVIEFKILRIQW
jgi:hypothetical protein